MNYEVRWGESFSIVEAGNPYQACILAMQQFEITERPVTTFDVLNLGTSKREEVKLADVISILVLSNNGDEDAEIREDRSGCCGTSAKRESWSESCV
jgi:hypothetical protein